MGSDEGGDEQSEAMTEIIGETGNVPEEIRKQRRIQT